MRKGIVVFLFGGVLFVMFVSTHVEVLKKLAITALERSRRAVVTVHVVDSDGVLDNAQATTPVAGVVLYFVGGGKNGIKSTNENGVVEIVMENLTTPVPTTIQVSYIELGIQFEETISIEPGNHFYHIDLAKINEEPKIVEGLPVDNNARELGFATRQPEADDLVVEATVPTVEIEPTPILVVTTNSELIAGDQSLCNPTMSSLPESLLSDGLSTVEIEESAGQIVFDVEFVDGSSDYTQSLACAPTADFALELDGMSQKRLDDEAVVYLIDFRQQPDGRHYRAAFSVNNRISLSYYDGSSYRLLKEERTRMINGAVGTATKLGVRSRQGQIQLFVDNHKLIDINHGDLLAAGSIEIGVKGENRLDAEVAYTNFGVTNVDVVDAVFVE